MQFIFSRTKNGQLMYHPGFPVRPKMRELMRKY
ncbi:MAG: hypothetical protein ACI8WB_004680, partial [Phenylobacterium sp.]